MRKLGYIAATVLGVGVLASAFIAVINRDKVGPEISFIDEDSFVYSKYMDEEDLKEFLTVVDEKDGDVSDTLMIESAQVNEADDTVKLVLVAVDSRYNVTRKSFEVPYSTNGQSAKADTKEEQNNETNSEDNQLSNEQQTNNQSDSQNDSESAASQETIAGTDASALVEQEIAALPEGAPQIRLHTYEITLEAGDSFSYAEYIESIVDSEDERSYLYANIQVHNEIDQSTPGEYEVSYYVTDSDGNRSNTAVLKVIVP